MRALSITVLLLLLSQASFAIGQGKGKGKGGSELEDDENMGPGFSALITSVSGDRVSFHKHEGMSRGKGKGKARSISGGTQRALLISDRALVTTATRARRTGDIQVGIELSGGIKNGIFDEPVSARVVVENDLIVEINVFVSEDDLKTPIAVKPKRPPAKR